MDASGDGTCLSQRMVSLRLWLCFRAYLAANLMLHACCNTEGEKTSGQFCAQHRASCQICGHRFQLLYKDMCQSHL